jgi:hypothetical protein
MTSNISRDQILKAFELFVLQFGRTPNGRSTEEERYVQGKRVFAERLEKWQGYYKKAEKRDQSFVSGRQAVKLTAKRLRPPVEPIVCALQDAALLKIEENFALPLEANIYLEGVLSAAEEALFGGDGGAAPNDGGWAYTKEDLRYAMRCFSYLALCAPCVNTLERYYTFLGMVSLFSLAVRKAEIGE